jgi:hypothetical protein
VVNPGGCLVTVVNPGGCLVTVVNPGGCLVTVVSSSARLVALVVEPSGLSDLRDKGVPNVCTPAEKEIYASCEEAVVPGRARGAAHGGQRHEPFE